jgi:hypothetical protein
MPLAAMDYLISFDKMSSDTLFRRRRLAGVISHWSNANQNA